MAAFPVLFEPIFCQLVLLAFSTQIQGHLCFGITSSSLNPPRSSAPSMGVLLIRYEDEDGRCSLPAPHPYPLLNRHLWQSSSGDSRPLFCTISTLFLSLSMASRTQKCDVGSAVFQASGWVRLRKRSERRESEYKRLEVFRDRSVIINYSA
ncbi:hypothetical protein BDN72DRAFT_845761 [Pluteus cervinus]|uniref:Uncharacterized protein n=1 Tax=Pluteus cervinus TaxID=181527 RepID=A0ACD3AHR5_9AGAR|nr:hypothetical protein BDN72DRAFT_845761 [Pluteus cervinus]